ncbi:MAG: putative lipid II flippase FtsW [Mariprofundaceae bacterium]
MKRLSPPDPWLTGCVLGLLALSLLMVWSASISVSEVRYGDPMRIIGRWTIYVPMGVALMLAASRIDPAWLKAIALPGLVATLALTALTLIPGVGTEINGARRWISLGVLTIQPVEFLKPAVVLYMAYYLSMFPDRLERFGRGLAPMLCVLGIALALLMDQPDFGSSLLLAATCFLMWFVGGVPVRQLTAVGGTGLVLAALALALEPYRLQRLTSFLDPWSDPYDSGYQLVQSMLAFGSGGLAGAGLGQGVQKLFYLPEAFTDFIAATIGEELGLVGTLALIASFALLLGRALAMAMRSRDDFARLLVLGCTLLIGFAFFINLGAAMGLLPTKGMPMPFISYGGSALLGDCLLIGLILAIQRHEPANLRQSSPRKGGHA